MDIHKGLGNANKIMNSIFMSIEDIIQISEIKGGSLRNAIPRESFATVVSTTNEAALLITEIDKVSNIVRESIIGNRYKECRRQHGYAWGRPHNNRQR